MCQTTYLVAFILFPLFVCIIPPLRRKKRKDCLFCKSGITNSTHCNHHSSTTGWLECRRQCHTGAHVAHRATTCIMGSCMAGYVREKHCISRTSPARCIAENCWPTIRLRYCSIYCKAEKGDDSYWSNGRLHDSSASFRTALSFSETDWDTIQGKNVGRWSNKGGDNGKNRKRERWKANNRRRRGIK